MGARVEALVGVVHAALERGLQVPTDGLVRISGLKTVVETGAPLTEFATA